MTYKLGIDVGGTFTDVVATNDTGLFTGKVASRPADEARAVLEAVAAVAAHYEKNVPDLLAVTTHIVLGTTVVTNAMLEYKGVKTGLITTEGFRDTIEIRRGYKESLFDLQLPAPFPDRPSPSSQGRAGAHRPEW